MTTPESEARALSQLLEQWTRHVAEVGAKCALGGDEAWDNVLRELAVDPLSKEERLRHVSEGPKRSRGAVPIELRWAATALYERGRSAARAIDLKITGSDATIDAIEHKLSSLVDEMLRAHIAATTPPVTTSNFFANAKATTPNYGAMGVGPGTSVAKCTTCRAPRQRTGEMRPCTYCGGKLE